jgi:hypothetical protein
MLILCRELGTADTTRPITISDMISFLIMHISWLRAKIPSLQIYFGDGCRFFIQKGRSREYLRLSTPEYDEQRLQNIHGNLDRVTGPRVILLAETQTHGLPVRNQVDCFRTDQVAVVDTCKDDN